MRIGRCARKCHVGRAAERAGVTHRIQRSQAKDEQHENRHDQSEQHRAAAREVAHFFFEHRCDRLRKSGQIPSHLRTLCL